MQKSQESQKRREERMANIKFLRTLIIDNK